MTDWKDQLHYKQSRWYPKCITTTAVVNLCRIRFSHCKENLPWKLSQWALFCMSYCIYKVCLHILAHLASQVFKIVSVKCPVGHPTLPCVTAIFTKLCLFLNFSLNPVITQMCDSSDVSLTCPVAESLFLSWVPSSSSPCLSGSLVLFSPLLSDWL